MLIHFAYTGWALWGLEIINLRHDSGIYVKWKDRKDILHHSWDEVRRWEKINYVTIIW